MSSAMLNRLQRIGDASTVSGRGYFLFKFLSHTAYLTNIEFKTAFAQRLKAKTTAKKKHFFSEINNENVLSR